MPMRSRARNSLRSDCTQMPKPNIPRKRAKLSFPPPKERLQDDFRIAMRVELQAFGFEFSAQFLVVVDLAIKDDDHVAVGAEHRLIAVRKIADAQANGAERNGFGGKRSGLVGTAMVKGGDSRRE